MYRLLLVLTATLVFSGCNTRGTTNPPPPPSDKPNIVFKADTCDGKGTLGFFMLPYDGNYYSEYWLGQVYYGATIARKGTSQSLSDFSTKPATFDWRFAVTRTSDKQEYTLQFRDPATGRYGISVPDCAETPEIATGRNRPPRPIDFELLSCKPTGEMQFRVTANTEPYDLELWHDATVQQRAQIAVGQSHTFNYNLPAGLQNVRIGAKTQGLIKNPANPGYKVFFSEMAIPGTHKGRGILRDDCATNARLVIVDQILEPIETTKF